MSSYGIMSATLSVMRPLAENQMDKQLMASVPEPSGLELAGDTVSLSPEGRQMAAAGQQTATSDQDGDQKGAARDYASQIRAQVKAEIGARAAGEEIDQEEIAAPPPSPEVEVSSYVPMSEGSLGAFKDEVSMSGSFISSRAAADSEGMTEDERLKKEQELKIVKESLGKGTDASGNLTAAEVLESSMG